MFLDLPYEFDVKIVQRILYSYICGNIILVRNSWQEQLTLERQYNSRRIQAVNFRRFGATTALRKRRKRAKIIRDSRNRSLMLCLVLNNLNSLSIFDLTLILQRNIHATIIYFFNAYCNLIQSNSLKKAWKCLLNQRDFVDELVWNSRWTVLRDRFAHAHYLTHTRIALKNAAAYDDVVLIVLTSYMRKSNFLIADKG